MQPKEEVIENLQFIKDNIGRDLEAAQVFAMLLGNTAFLDFPDSSEDEFYFISRLIESLEKFSTTDRATPRQIQNVTNQIDILLSFWKYGAWPDEIAIQRQDNLSTDDE